MLPIFDEELSCPSVAVQVEPSFSLSVNTYSKSFKQVQFIRESYKLNFLFHFCPYKYYSISIMTRERLYFDE